MAEEEKAGWLPIWLEEATNSRGWVHDSILTAHAALLSSMAATRLSSMAEAAVVMTLLCSTSLVSAAEVVAVELRNLLSWIPLALSRPRPFSWRQTCLSLVVTVVVVEEAVVVVVSTKCSIVFARAVGRSPSESSVVEAAAEAEAVVDRRPPRDAAVVVVVVAAHHDFLLVEQEIERERVASQVSQDGLAAVGDRPALASPVALAKPCT